MASIIESNNEIGSLANSFNQMAAARQQAEEQRLILIAKLEDQNSELEDAYKAQRHAAEEIAVMAEIGRTISSSPNIGDVYEIFDENDNGTMSPTWVLGTDVPGLREGDDFPMEKSLAGEVVRTKAPYMLEADTEPDLEDRFPGLIPVYNAGTVSFMAVPLISRDVVIGVLRVGSKLRGIYTQWHLELLQRMGNQIAGAIANASLYARQMEADEKIRNLAKFPSEDPNPVTRMSAEGIIMYANAAAIRILKDRGVNGGESTSDIFQKLVKEVLASGTVSKVEIDYGPRVISYSLVPVQGAGYANIYGRDITASKESDRLKEEFISTVSHELRTPLTSIKGAAEILLNYPDEDSAVRAEFLGIINNESDRLTRLINNVLDLAKIESGQMQWHMSRVDLPSVIETAVESTYALTVQKDLTVEISPCEDLPAAVADPDRLVQVITNLLSNAVKFTPSGGFIRVQTQLAHHPNPKTGGEMVEISVSDNGIGIPASEFARIFDRFQQVSTTLSDKPQGTGLGLPISKERVEHLGGEIWVESELGEGSTFRFTVPV